MTLLREIQLLLERTYAPVPINLELCLIDDRRCAALTRRAGPEAAALAPSGRTFLRQEDGALHLAIFYAAPVIAELEANDPRRAINERNIAPLITFIEEIAHGVQAALLFLDGERAIETESYARNLETQARVDTYLVLSKFAALLGGGEIPRRAGAWLRRQVFDDGHQRFGNARLRERYHAAQGCARIFLRRLRRIPFPDRLDMLRKFRAMSWETKQSFLRAA
jgi:hypothetical protein